MNSLIVATARNWLQPASVWEDPNVEARKLVVFLGKVNDHAFCTCRTVSTTSSNTHDERIHLVFHTYRPPFSYEFLFFSGTRRDIVSIDHICEFHLQNKYNNSTFGSHKGVVCAFRSIDLSAEKSGRRKVNSKHFRSQTQITDILPI